MQKKFFKPGLEFYNYDSIQMHAYNSETCGGVPPDQCAMACESQAGNFCSENCRPIEPTLEEAFHTFVGQFYQGGSQ